MAEPELICLADVKRHSPEESARIESAFRRGYYTAAQEVYYKLFARDDVEWRLNKWFAQTQSWYCDDTKYEPPQL